MRWGADPVATEALTGVLGAFGCNRGVLFELTTRGDSGFAPTAVSAGLTSLERPIRFPADSLLPRWMRVNRQALPVPDDIGVFGALTSQEQETLREVSARAAVPLIVEKQLIGWATLSDRPDRIPDLGAGSSALDDIARRLLAARLAAEEKARADSLARTNKLSLTGEMAAGIAHEVRNPLAAVRSMVQLVRNGAIPASEQGQVLDNVVTEIDRVNSVVTNLMMLGRPSASRTEAVELMALVADAVNFCRAYARQRSQSLEIALNTRLWVRGDSLEIRQVLVNLLLNACQASGDGQAVLIQGRSDTDSAGVPVAIVEVVDEGAGIPPSVLSQIFDPFFTTKANGGGLGLCLCRDVMTRSGGSIVVTSEPGVGTRVTLTFPQ